MLTGQYTILDGRFKFRYLVRKVNKKTAVVSIINYMDGETVTHTTNYRYPLTLLESQIQEAEYLPFKL